MEEPAMVETAMVEHFELAQGARGTPPEAKLFRGRVVELSRVQSSIDQCKFIRFSSDSFPDLEGEQIMSLHKHCLDAHRSEDFYINAAPNQWVRTSIACDSDPQKLYCSSVGSSNIIIQSNVLPCDPFLTTLDQSSKRIHFPCSLLMGAYNQKKSLMKKLLEWRAQTHECELSELVHASENSVGRSLRLFWEIQDGWKDLKQFAKGSEGTVWLVIWKGGRFVRKERLRGDSDKDADPRDVLDTELNVTEKLSHPHIVYSFGVSFATDKSSLFMEYMQHDLQTLIIELVRKDGSNGPPFSHQDSLDILLQTAKAMVYMHEQNVVHGDLKCLNILVSEFFVSSNATQYLVKVADFGSARSMNESKDFEPGGATTDYAAPEVLRRRSDKSVVISHPKSIDVYSFGIIAFEVLTGLKPYSDYHYDLKGKKEGIIGGTLRPPLRKECQKVNFLYDRSLHFLIERCWDEDPLQRPSFLNVVDVLNKIKARLLEPSTSRSGLHPRQVFSSVAQNVSGLHRSQSRSLPSRHQVGLERIGMASLNYLFYKGLAGIGLASLKHLLYKGLAGVGLASIESSDINAQSARPEISFELQSRDLPSTRLLGKGLAGIGYETTWEGARYARKDFYGVQKDIFLKESSRLVRLRDHKNIVKTFGWTTDKRSCSLVLEYMDGDLVSLLQKTRNSNKVLSKQSSTSPFDLPEALDMMVQIAAGVAHLHGEKLAHGDLKTKNILISAEKGGELSSQVVKVADFGLVQTKRKSEFIVSRQVRKLEMVQWKAPECWRMKFMRKLNSEDETSSESESESSSSSASGASFTPPIVNVVDEFAADVYSFALICSELLTGDTPYRHMKWKELGHKILDGLRPDLPDTCHPMLKVLLMSCWGESAQRPSFAVVCYDLTLIKQSLITVIASFGQEISFELQSGDLPSTRLLGKGLAGIGYETRWKGGRYARKDFFGVQKDIFLEEAPRLVGLRDHKNIVKTYGWTTDKRSCSLVLEYMDGDLVSLLQKTRNSNKVLSKQSSTSPFDLPEALDMMVQIAAGVACLHGEKLAHGDLKTKNILVSRVKGGALNSMVVKVADFGLVQTKRKSEFIVSRQVRKLEMVQWKAPECWRMQFKRKLNSEDETSSESDSESASEVSSTSSATKNVNKFAADVYSFAMICSELLTGDTPYRHMKWKELGHKILGGLRPDLPDTCHPMLKGLLMSCWRGNPAKRPSFAIICSELTSIQQSIATAMTQPHEVAMPIVAPPLADRVVMRASTEESPGSSSSRRPSTSTMDPSSDAAVAAVASLEARRQVVTPPARTVIIQPLLASYTWPEVECMRTEAGYELLGKGGFGDVFKGKLANGKFVAIKFLNEGSRQGDSEFLNEVNLLSTVNHRNLVKLLGYCQEGSHRVLVYEYAEEGDIFYHIHGKGDLDWRTRLKISMEAATGLEYLHTGCSQMIVHRDIKSSNILLTKDLDAKVADFGLSKMGPVEGNTNNTRLQFDTLVKGTPGYLDPAYSKTGKLDERSDIYSFGIVLLELITGRLPNCATSDPSNVIHIKDWVIAQTGGLKLTVDAKSDAKSDAKLKKISDPKLDGKFNLKAMREVFTLALRCVDDDPKKRPDIRIVVAQLRAAIVNQDNTSHASKWSLRSLLGRTS